MIKHIKRTKYKLPLVIFAKVARTTLDSINFVSFSSSWPQSHIDGASTYDFTSKNTGILYKIYLYLPISRWMRFNITELQLIVRLIHYRGYNSIRPRGAFKVGGYRRRPSAIISRQHHSNFPLRGAANSICEYSKWYAFIWGHRDKAIMNDPELDETQDGRVISH